MKRQGRFVPGFHLWKPDNCLHRETMWATFQQACFRWAQIFHYSIVQDDEFPSYSSEGAGQNKKEVFSCVGLFFSLEIWNCIKVRTVVSLGEDGATGLSTLWLSNDGVMIQQFLIIVCDTHRPFQNFSPYRKFKKETFVYFASRFNHLFCA